MAANHPSSFSPARGQSRSQHRVPCPKILNSLRIACASWDLKKPGIVLKTLHYCILTSSLYPKRGCVIIITILQLRKMRLKKVDPLVEGCSEAEEVAWTWAIQHPSLRVTITLCPKTLLVQGSNFTTKDMQTRKDSGVITGTSLWVWPPAFQSWVTLHLLSILGKTSIPCGLCMLVCKENKVLDHLISKISHRSNFLKLICNQAKGKG